MNQTVKFNEELFNETLFKVLELNPKAVLSGSYGLRLQEGGWYPERDIHDLDFELPYDLIFNTDKELLYDGAGNRYISETHNIFLGSYKNVSINMFQAILPKDEIKEKELVIINKKILEVISAKQIIFRKLLIAMEVSGSGSFKHASDLIEILTRKVINQNNSL